MSMPTDRRTPPSQGEAVSPAPSLSPRRAFLTRVAGFSGAAATAPAWMKTLGIAAGGIAGLGSAPRASADPSLPDMVNTKTAQAIDRGLAYLARTQARDGVWRSGGMTGSYPTAMTALAGLALLAGGHTPVEGRYAANVRRMVDALVGSTTPQGLIAKMDEERSVMHGHGFAMLTLAEAYGMERSETRQSRIRKALGKVIRLTARSQSAAGGWLYTPDSNSDEGSVTVTQIQGLRACRNAGIKVPKSTISRAAKYIENSANPDGGIRYRATGGGSSRPALTAAAVATMYNAGEYENPIAVKCLANLKKHLKASGGRISGGHQFYMLLYTAQAMYLSSEENWKGFFPKTRDWLVTSQQSSGAWTGSMGPSYVTSIALLTLLLPYGNLPIFQR